MSIQIIPDNFSQEEFNTVALHPLQTWEWGEARKETEVEVIRIGEFENHILKNIFQLTIHKIPKLKYQIGYVPRSVFPSKDALDFLEDFGKKNNLIFIKIEPYTKKEEIDIQMLKSQNLQRSPHGLFPEWTQMLDITPSEEELMKNMKQKTRYNIRLAERKGVIIKEESNKEGFEKFITLYFETCKRQHYYGHTKTYHEIIWNNLKNNIAHILIAYYNEEPLAAYELFHFKDTLYYPYGGSSTKYREVMASNLLMWEAIKLGKNLGAKTFDMWGSLSPNYMGEDVWAGFTRFKEGYGTNYISFIGSYDLIINQVFYTMYNIAHVLRSFYLKIK